MSLDDWNLCQIRNRSKISNKFEQHNDQDQREPSHRTVEDSDLNSLDDFIVKMNNGNACIRDSNELITQSNNVIQSHSLFEIVELNTHERDHHQRCSYYQIDQQLICFGPQLIHSMDDIVETNDFLVTMNIDNASIKDSNELIIKSNNVTQMHSLFKIAEVNAHDKDHHQICSNYQTDPQPVGSGPQVILSIDDTI
ncbi:hypothetical protein U1Q18_036175 [Sarracenia purpurea var. burkii]